MTAPIPDEPQLLVEESEGVMVLTLNRPRRRNAATAEMARRVGAALDRLERSAELRVAVITGAGGAFCSGMDLEGFARGEMPLLGDRGFLGLTQREGDKPLIAAVEGPALAGGFETVLACDVVVASRSAVFGLPEVRLGLAAGAGGLIRLPRRVPENVAMELALTGDTLDAARAHELGLASQLTDVGAALDCAMTIARRIVANAPLAVAAARRVVRAQRDWSSANAFDRQLEAIGQLEHSEDAQEGARAFLEKREPRWRGR
jgi:enoyl-CoA hydratase